MNNNRLALHRAIKRYDVTEVRKLLGLRGEKRVNIEARNDGDTPLLYAVELYLRIVYDMLSYFYFEPMHTIEPNVLTSLSNKERQEVIKLINHLPHNMNVNQINFVNNMIMNQINHVNKPTKKQDFLNELLFNIESQKVAITINNMNNLNVGTKQWAKEWRQKKQNAITLLQIITMLVGAGANLTPGPSPRTPWYVMSLRRTPFSVPEIIKQHKNSHAKEFINDLKSAIAKVVEQ